MSKKIILVIEDDENISFALSSLLEIEGYTVFTAGNGAIALELLRQHGMPNLILLDMIMPVMTGWQFASEFRTRYDQKIPIIVMTAAADAEKRAKDVGASAWVGKPFELDHLLGLIKKLLIQ